MDFQLLRGVTLIVLCLGLVLGAIVGFANWLVSIECHSKANAMGIPSTYGFFQGCIVKYHGELIPIDQIGVRTFEERKP